MSLTAFASTRIWGMAFAAFLAVLAMSAGAAQADPCADSCRSQHNGCRMAAKLLYSARCDAQLQSCISQCFAAGRFSREREGRDHRGEFGDRRDMRPPVDMRGPPEGRVPPEMHGPPRDFRGPGQRWLGGPGGFERRGP
ncbi:hypothetical protein [Hyphomicrobium sp.]|uniref:hypothetical protein n=1 Tax=Hyphomicrobium sp. TaxID=82 RepID=UPI000FB27EBA|nr:hypothetical protein [Hyphomicrobium sp.]RUO99880.1 MAG: hypothetical protein EKK30_04030 [Hyphomicrobium sp.]